MSLKCPICNAKKISRISDRQQLYQCNDCSHRFTIIDKDKQEQYSDDYFDKGHKNWFENPNYSLFNFIYGEITKFAKGKEIDLLDVGCGKGDFLKFIADKKNSGIKLVGIDLTSNVDSRIEFIKGDFLEYRFSRKFDVICCLAVVEHIHNPNVFVTKLYKLLKPGGMLCVMTINSNSLIHKIARFLNLVGVYSAYDRLYSVHHVQHYTDKSLCKLMENNKFKVVVQKIHNYPLKAVDLPRSNFIIENLYKLVVAVIFMISENTGSGILQTVVCKK